MGTGLLSPFMFGMFRMGCLNVWVLFRCLGVWVLILLIAVRPRSNASNCTYSLLSSSIPRAMAP